MSLVKFNLTDEHIALVQQLRFVLNDTEKVSKFKKNKVEITETNIQVEDEPEFKVKEILVDPRAPFGSFEDNIYQEIALILGIPHIEGTELEWGGKQYDEDAKKKMDKLYEELPMALDIIMYFGEFNAGEYKTKFGVREWKVVELFCETVKNK